MVCEFTCRQSGELALEQHSVFRSIWSMQAKSVSSSLSLQNDFKFVVDAEIAQPVEEFKVKFNKFVQTYNNKPCWHFGSRAWEQHDRPIQCDPRSIDSMVLFMHVQKSTWMSGQNFLRFWSRLSLIDADVANCTSDNWNDK